MSIAIAEPPQTTTPVEKETTVGNYFVSNYPPFSFWKPEHVGEVAAALGRPPAPGTRLGVYLHIPFCRKRCHFCYFRVYTDKDSTAIKGYLELAIRELERSEEHTSELQSLPTRRSSDLFAHPVLPETLPLLLLSGLHGQRLHRHQGLSGTGDSRAGALRQAAVHWGPQAAVYLLRRGGALLPVRAAAPSPTPP